VAIAQLNAARRSANPDCLTCAAAAAETGYSRDGLRYFVGNPRTIEEGIQMADDALKDRSRRFIRAEVKDIRAGEVVCGGTH
jgi:hypothetical protein